MSNSATECSEEGRVVWASVDLGTNTFRLLIAEEREVGVLRQRALLQEVVRLGQGIDGRGTLLPEAVERAEALLRRFRNEMDEAGATRRVGALTAAGRGASDGPAFCARACRLLDARVRVLPGQEEARLSAAGALSLLDAGERDVVFVDIGGGSTEVVARRDGREVGAVSLPVGVVQLHEALAGSATGAGGSPDPDLERRAVEAFAGLPEAFDAPRWADALAHGTAVLLATAGTPLTVAAQVHGRNIAHTRALNGLWVARAQFERVRTLFGSLSAAERGALASVEPGREDVILAGLALLGAFLDRFGAPGFVVSDGGLLEGVLLAAVRDERGQARWGEAGLAVKDGRRAGTGGVCR